MIFQIGDMVQIDLQKPYTKEELIDGCLNEANGLIGEIIEVSEYPNNNTCFCEIKLEKPIKYYNYFKKKIMTMTTYCEYDNNLKLIKSINNINKSEKVEVSKEFLLKVLCCLQHSIYNSEEITKNMRKKLIDFGWNCSWDIAEIFDIDLNDYYVNIDDFSIK